MIKQQQYESFFGSTQAQESEQIKIRLLIVLFILVVEILFIYFSTMHSNNLWIIVLLSLLYLFYTLGYMVLLKKEHHFFVAYRRDATMAIDIVIVTIGIYLLNEVGTLLTPIYLIILIGNGLRYGVTMMLKGFALSIASIVFLLFFNVHWQENIYLGISLAVSMVFVTFIVYKILKRLKGYHSQLNSALREVSFLAYHDSLTKLANRHSFELELAKRIRQKKHFYLLFIDLDGFKYVNDQYGHEVGDAVLIEVARRLEKHLDSAAYIARISGDEFVVLTAEEHLSEKSLTLLLLALHDTYTHHRINSVSASIGIARFPEDSSQEHLLLRYADEAMYDAKRSGKNCYKFFKGENND